MAISLNDNTQDAAGAAADMSALPFAAQLTLWMWRQWWWGRRSMGRPPERYWQAWRRLGDEAAGLRFDLLAGLLMRLGAPPPAALPPGALGLLPAEAALLRLLAAWQADAPDIARHAARLVPYPRQSALFDWAGREVAAALLLCGLDLTAGPACARPVRFTFASNDKRL